MDFLSLTFGVDPGLTYTGYALLEDGLVFHHKTVNGKLALDYLVRAIKAYSISRAVVERPKESVLYQKHLYGAKVRGAHVSDSYKFKICMDIGKNVLISDMIIETLKKYGVKTKVENPRAGETKWNKDKWRSVFKWGGTRLPSEHARDAAVRALLNEGWYGWDLTQEEIDKNEHINAAVKGGWRRKTGARN